MDKKQKRKYETSRIESEERVKIKLIGYPKCDTGQPTSAEAGICSPIFLTT